jgi:HSP20 family protein
VLPCAGVAEIDVGARPGAWRRLEATAPIHAWFSSAEAASEGDTIMAIERWDPFREAVSLSDAVGQLLRESFIRPGGGGHAGAPAVASLPLDVVENENEFVIRASLPGIKPEDVQITVHGDTLTIRGESKFEEEKKGEVWHLRERRYGAFQRTVGLATPIDSDKAQAKYDHGVLTLTLPKAEQAKPRQIKIGS